MKYTVVTGTMFLSSGWRCVTAYNFWIILCSLQEDNLYRDADNQKSSIVRFIIDLLIDISFEGTSTTWKFERNKQATAETLLFSQFLMEMS